MKDRLMKKGYNLGIELKNRNIEEDTRKKLFHIAKHNISNNERLECLAEFADICEMELPTIIIAGAGIEKEKRILRYMMGIVNALNDEGLCKIVD